MRPTGFIVCLLAIAIAGITPAVAGYEEDRQVCNADESEPDASIAACTRQINSGRRKGQDLAISYNNRGYSYDDKGDLDRAMADYNQAIRLDPKFALAYNNRGIVYRKKGEYDRAIADYNEAIRLDPKYAKAYNNRGNVYRNKQDYDRAIADYTQAIRLDPKYAKAYYSRGSSHDDKGDYDRAIADYNDAIRIDPKYVNAYNNRGVAYRNKREYDRAIADYTQAIRLDPKFAYAYYNRSLVLEDKGDIAAAYKDVAQALALDPTDTDMQRRNERLRTAVAALPQQTARVPADLTPAPLPAPLPAPRTSDTGRRVALVIGNSDYRSVSFLPNPRGDAAEVAAALRSAGFQTVTLESDLGREALVKALRAFARQAENADWALVYFAGHGMEMNGVNYLLPVDAKIEIDRDVEFEAVPLNQVMSAVDGAKKLRLVLLDACRDNPFKQMRRTIATRSIGRGLAKVEPDAGTLVVYAAKDGEVALDGEGVNSPFATALVRNLLTPGLEVRRLFDLVRDDVLELTNRRQQPFSYGSVSGRQDFFFVQK